MRKEKISLKDLIERNKEELLKDSSAIRKIEYRIEDKIQKSLK
jgi:Fur-regulated basic protein B